MTVNAILQWGGHWPVPSRRSSLKRQPVLPMGRGIKPFFRLESQLNQRHSSRPRASRFQAAACRVFRPLTTRQTDPETSRCPWRADDRTGNETVPRRRGMPCRTGMDGNGFASVGNRRPSGHTRNLGLTVVLRRMPPAKTRQTGSPACRIGAEVAVTRDSDYNKRRTCVEAVSLPKDLPEGTR